MKKLQLFLLVLFLLMVASAVRAADAMYAVLNGTTLTFYYDGNKSSRSGTPYNMNKAGVAPSWAKNASIKTVVFDSSFKNARPTATTAWFYNLTSLTSISGIGNLNTSSVTNMVMMFYGCPLSSIDVSGFNTSNVTTMRAMFFNCSNLTSVNVSGFNTSKVTDMYGMFYNCTKLASVNVSGFDTSKVTDISYMFEYCSALTSLDLSKFTFTSSQNTEYMMASTGLKTLTIPATANALNQYACNSVGSASAPCTLNYPSGFTPEKTATSTNYYRWKNGYFKDGTITPSDDDEVSEYAVLSGSTLTFYYDDKKSSRSGTKYTLNTGSTAPGWNGSATSVTKVVFDSSFDEAWPVSCYRWFYNMSKLTTITGLEYLHTDDVGNMAYMFYGCTALTGLNLEGFDTSNVTDMSYMFSGCTKLSNLVLYKEQGFSPWGISSYYSDFVTTAATNLRNMFAGCTSLSSLELPDFVITSSKNSTDMFKGCTALESLHIQGDWTGVNASAFSGVGTASNPCYLDFPDATISGETSRTPTYFIWKAGYFEDYRKAYVLYNEDDNSLSFNYGQWIGSGWSEIHDYYLNEGSTAPGWLEFASQVKSVEIDESFKDVRPTSLYQWFANMTGITAIKGLENINTEYVTNMASMFSGCTKITSLDVGTFDTKNVTTMYRMFYNCSGLKSLTLYGEAYNLGEYIEYSSKFKTDKATTLKEMFCGCKNLGELVLSGFTVTSSTNTTNMLKGCSALEELFFDKDMEALNASACDGVGTPSKPCSLINPKYIPQGSCYAHNGQPYLSWKKGCFVDGAHGPYTRLVDGVLTFYYGIRYLYGDDFSLNDGATAPDWLDYASQVKSVVFSEDFKYAAPTTAYAWFRNMDNLTSIDGLENLNKDHLKNLSYMFSGCSKLTSLDLSDFEFNFAVELTENTMAVADSETKYMLNGCSGLQSLKLNSYANSLDNTACSGVGTSSKPCSLDFKGTIEGASSHGSYFIWKSGYFKDGASSAVWGDANLDGGADISDVITIVDYLLNKTLTKFSYANADVDRDGVVLLADALIIVDKVILGKTSAPPAPRWYSTQDVMSLTGQGSELELHLKGAGTFRGAEMTLTLPEGCSLREAALSPARSNGHEVLVNDLGEGVYRLVVMALNGKPLGNGESAFIRLSIDGNHGNNLKVSDIMMVSSDLQVVALADVHGIATGIDTIGQEAVSDGEWYNMQGQHVASPHQGIYIRNGKKYLVK